MSIESIGGIQLSGITFNSMSAQNQMVGEQHGANFLQLLTQQVSSVNSKIETADNMMIDYMKGENVAVHDVMIAMSQAKKELQLFVEVRNKVLESYQTITRIQL